MISEVHNCDCMEYMANIPNDFFDLVIADPPYRDINSPTLWMQRKQSNDKLFVAGKPKQDFFHEINRIGKECIVFGANNFGYSFDGFIAWDKMVRGSSRYSQVEIASLSKGLSTVSTLVSISCYDKNGKIHPTQKPPELYYWIYQNYLPKIVVGGVECLTQ